MAVQIDETLVRRMARLARLRLSDQEVDLFSRQLTRILDYVQQLDTVDTEGVEPMAHPLAISNIDRDDQPGGRFDSERALANAPERRGRLFRVPAVLDQGSGA